MVQEEKDRVVNTDRKIEEQSYKREPHERDESPDGQGVKPRGIIKQAGWARFNEECRIRPRRRSPGICRPRAAPSARTSTGP